MYDTVIYVDKNRGMTDDNILVTHVVLYPNEKDINKNGYDHFTLDRAIMMAGPNATIYCPNEFWHELAYSDDSSKECTYRGHQVYCCPDINCILFTNEVLNRAIKFHNMVNNVYVCLAAGMSELNCPAYDNLSITKYWDEDQLNHFITITAAYGSPIIYCSPETKEKLNEFSFNSNGSHYKYSKIKTIPNLNYIVFSTNPNLFEEN